MLVLCLLSIVISTLGEVGTSSYAGYLLVCPRFMVSRITIIPFGAGGGLRSLTGALPGYLFIITQGLINISCHVKDKTEESRDLSLWQNQWQSLSIVFL